jgi:hypothetical protein
LGCPRPRIAGKGAEAMEHFIGCDVHTRYQVVAWVEKGTGEIRVRRLEHQTDEVKSFYSGWPKGTVVGIEATFPALWFERLLGECGHQLWVGGCNADSGL